MKKTTKYILCIIVTILIITALVACDKPLEIDEPTIWNNQNAYAYAQALGYEGTLEEFIESVSGSDGVGITSINLNSDFELIITLSDSEEINIGVIRGPAGSNGIDGVDGMSAYDIYRQYNPDYEGTEIEWFNELIKDYNLQNQQGLDFFLNNDRESYSVGCGTAVYLSSIVIPDTYNDMAVNRIAHKGFYRNKSLKSIVIPGSITSIDDYAFSESEQLESVTISASVQLIGQSAFSSCTKLEDITVSSDTPCLLSNNVFDGIDNLNIFVPAAHLDTYRVAEGWDGYTASIYPRNINISFSVGDEDIIVMNSIQVRNNTCSELPVPSREGMVFSGWLDGDGVGAELFSDKFGVIISGKKISTSEIILYPNYEDPQDPIYYLEDGFVYFGWYPQKVACANAVTHMQTTPDANGYYTSTYDYAKYAKVTATPHTNNYNFSTSAIVVSGSK